MNAREAFEYAKKLTDEERWDEAVPIIYRYLKADPNSAPFLTLLTFCFLSTEKAGLAYQTGKRAAQEAPKEFAVWLNLGLAAQDLWMDREAIRYYKEGLRCARDEKQVSQVCVNLSSCMVDNGRFEEAIGYAERALKQNPDSVKGRANLGFAQLALRQWVPGWENYSYAVGCEWRPRMQFNDEPIWDGKSKGVIAVWGEQGLGDEISFASMLPDMQEWCKKNNSELIVECNPRLGTLFKRSFPDVTIQPTRGELKVGWDVTRVNYSIAAAQLGEYFRLKDEDFQGTPYLTADPDRVIQWKALFESKRKPVIGLAWRSGIPKTGGKYRQLDLERLLPILRSVDAHWVSLQYKPAGKEIKDFREKYPDIDIVEYPHGTLTNDYDDTVAMIAAMDEIVCMHTTANHVAGALGVPAKVLVPISGQWRYGDETKTDFPWAKSLRLYRQQERGQWDDIINELAKDLHEHYSDRDDLQQRKSQHKKGRPRRVQKGKSKSRGNSSQRSSSGIKSSGREDLAVRPKDERPLSHGDNAKASSEGASIQM